MRGVDGREVVLHEPEGSEGEAGEFVEECSTYNVDVELAAD